MAVQAYNSRIYVTSQPAVTFTNEATTDSGDHKTFTITNQAKRYLDRDTAVVVQKGNDELQSVTITGSPTGGSFTLTFGANTTTSLNWNATASQVQSALQALASIGANNALVTGGPGPGTAFQVQFAAGKGLASQSLITATSSLTGGTAPTVTIARVQAGAAYATITSGYKLYRVNARVTFTATQPVGTHVQLASGKYFVVAQIGEASSAEFAGKVDTVETTVFSDTPAKTYIPTLFSGTFKMGTFWLNKAHVSALLARDLLIVAFDAAGGDKYEGYCYTTDSDIKNSLTAAITEDITFLLTNEFFMA
jgi:hypothetical protein